MSQLNIQTRKRAPKVVNFLPGSSYVGTAGQLWDVLKDQEQGSTVAPMVWYGTLNAGIRVREKYSNFVVIQGTLKPPPVAEGKNNITRLDTALSKKLSEIRRMIRLGDVPKARSLLQSLSASIRSNPVVSPLVRALEIPKARMLQSGSGHRISRQWLRDNSQEYKGKWVAVFDNRLVGDDDSCIRLRDRVRSERENLAGVQFLFVG